ncbi:MAG: hypothetical protein JNL28_01820 [Planctomycetes bacterium]|nr:hypothetical protein [Planctomycetota bacterium]
MKTPTLLALIGVLGLGATILFGQGTDSEREARAQTTYFASGKIESRIEYDAGRRDGLGERWYSNGTKQSEGRYEAGRMEGEWRFWNADGTVDAERSGNYRAGDKVSSEVGGDR